MKIKIDKNYFFLIVAISAWIASIILILFPINGSTTIVFPPKPVESYKLIFLILTAAIASIYSMKLGLNQLYPDGLKLGEKINSIRKNKL
jgi:hypothetical protein